MHSLRLGVAKQRADDRRRTSRLSALKGFGILKVRPDAAVNVDGVLLVQDREDKADTINEGV
jgi:hypothetical protein